jgi:hypothetical protein
MEEVGQDLSSIEKIMEYAREYLKTEANLKKVGGGRRKDKNFLEAGLKIPFI